MNPRIPPADLKPVPPAATEPPTEAELDEAIEESFPASDPPAFVTPHAADETLPPKA